MTRPWRRRASVVEAVEAHVLWCPDGVERLFWLTRDGLWHLGDLVE